MLKDCLHWAISGAQDGTGGGQVRGGGHGVCAGDAVRADCAISRDPAHAAAGRHAGARTGLPRSLLSPRSSGGDPD